MRNSLIKLVAIFLLFIVFVSSCKKEETENTEIVIGLIIPETGAASSIGESANAAISIGLADIRQYFDDIGLDKTIRIYSEDCGTDPLQALQKLKLLKEKGVQLVIGPFSSAAVQAVKDYADQNDILIISPASVAPSLSIPGDNIYRLIPNDNNQGEAMTALLNDDSIEVLIPIIRDDLWGNELLEATTQHFTNSNGSVAPAIRYSTSSTEYSSYISQLKSDLNDALIQYSADKIGIYMLSFGEGTDILNLASSEIDLKQVKWYGGSAYAENSSLPLNIDAAAFAYNCGLHCPIFENDPAAKDKWQPLNDEIKVQIGRQPEIYALLSYDALWLATLTYLTAGSDAKTDNLITAFEYEAKNYFGATGRTVLNAAGDRVFATFEFWGIKYLLNDYSWQLVARYNNATGELDRY